MKDIPIKIPTSETENKILDLYTLIKDFKNQNRFSNTKNLESKIDDIIYKIYDLTAEEINFIKNFELEFKISEVEEG